MPWRHLSPSVLVPALLAYALSFLHPMALLMMSGLYAAWQLDKDLGTYASAIIGAGLLIVGGAGEILRRFRKIQREKVDDALAADRQRAIDQKMFELQTARLQAELDEVKKGSLTGLLEDLKKDVRLANEKLHDEKSARQAETIRRESEKAEVDAERARLNHELEVVMEQLKSSNERQGHLNGLVDEQNTRLKHMTEELEAARREKAEMAAKLAEKAEILTAKVDDQDRRIGVNSAAIAVIKEATTGSADSILSPGTVPPSVPPPIPEVPTP